MTKVEIIQFLLLVPMNVLTTYQYNFFHFFAFWYNCHINFHSCGFSLKLEPNKCWLSTWIFGQTFSVTLSQTK